jgi:hypothetical protein
LIEYVDKIPNTLMAADVCATTTAKSRLCPFATGLSPDRQTRYELAAKP